MSPWADVLDAARDLQGRPLAVALVAVALLILVITAVGARRTADRRLRWAALLVGLSACWWNAAHAAIALGAPLWVEWAITRPIEFLLLGVSFTFLPRAAGSARDWFAATVHGFLTSGGVLVVSWMLLADPGVRAGLGLDPHVRFTPLLLWVMHTFVGAGLLGGVLARRPPGRRRGIFWMMVFGNLVGVADLLWAVTGVAAPALLLFAAMGVLLVLPMLGGDPAALPRMFALEERSRTIGLAQLPTWQALFFLFAPVQHDLFASALAGIIVGTCFVTMVVHGQENLRLIGTVTDQRASLEALLADSGDGLVQVGRTGLVVYANQAASGIIGIPVDELAGFDMKSLGHRDDRARVVREFQRLRDGMVEVVEIAAPWRRPDGRDLHVEMTVSSTSPTGPVEAGWVIAFRDVTERVEMQQVMARQARQDPLTGLLNRSAFLAAVQARLDEDAERPATVLFVDLDGFKLVNDNLGHGAGDEVLRSAAAKLRQVLPAEDDLGRIGGDEFAVLIGGTAVPQAVPAAERAAQRILGALGAVYPPGRPELSQTASIGIAAAAGTTPEELLVDADLAMYRAKAAGGGHAVRFEPWMRDRMLERIRLRGRLESAIAGDLLSLAMQPVVDLSTGRWEGMEALVRWVDGSVRRMPDEFIPLAEESGLVVPLGAWVLRAALRELAAWDASTGPELHMAVNVSPRQLESDGFDDLVLDALATTGVDAGRLTLEITEQTAVHDLRRTASRLSPLRERGIKVAIDDFGTGFSSMRYLTRLPVDILKIDRQFVDGLGTRRQDEVLVTSMLRLAADLGLEVVAEGVETELQAEVLRSHGCRLAQGYLYSAPQSSEALRERIPVPRTAPDVTRSLSDMA